MKTHIPFVKNVESNGIGNGHSVSDITNAFASAVRDDTEKKQRSGYPVARYDTVKKQAYLETADGTREYVNR